ncbi:MAG: 50S ribosomal protein L10 [Candidatus Cloacimonadales bacterium]
MTQPYKIEEVKKIKAALEAAKSIVLIDYKGINIEEVDELRNRMRNSDVKYFVSKNTFIKIALNDLGITELDQYLVGSTAVAVAADEVSPARELANFKKEITKEKNYPSFKAGFVGGELMDIEQLGTLADLPTKDQLISMVLQGFNAPLTGMVGTLQAIIKKFVYVVDAIAEKEEQK